MIAPACVIDCSAEAAANADFLLTIAHAKAWERRHGTIPARHWVLMRTDWSKKGWRDYANLRDDGAHTPGPDAAVMRWLVEERGILGFGTETIGTDAGQGMHFDPPSPPITFSTAPAATGFSACAISISCRLSAVSSWPHLSRSRTGRGSTAGSRFGGCRERGLATAFLNPTTAVPADRS